MKLFLAIVAAVLTACATTPTNPEAWMERELNSCLPTAIAMREGLNRQGIWAEVFTYRFNNNGKLGGHAMTAYLYPSGENRLWAYDSMGSWRVRAFTNDVESIARIAHSQRRLSTNVWGAAWVK
jgi:hypothetical protein